jgi:hypothetical protein
MVARVGGWRCVLRERAEASDERCVVNGYADFFLNRSPGFIVNATRIF